MGFLFADPSAERNAVSLATTTGFQICASSGLVLKCRTIACVFSLVSLWKWGLQVVLLFFLLWLRDKWLELYLLSFYLCLWSISPLLWIFGIVWFFFYLLLPFPRSHRDLLWKANRLECEVDNFALEIMEVFFLFSIWVILFLILINKIEM